MASIGDRRGMNKPADAPPGAAAPRSEIGFSLAEVTRLLRAAFDQRMRVMGLTGSSWRVITSLSRENGQTQASLAERLEISRVALGEAVDRLEKTGHVLRCADPADRRVWRVHLTPLSRDLLPLMFATADELQADCFRDLSEADLAHLQAILARLRGRLLEMRIEPPDEEAGQ
jgi:DNA-binding MarR family transcriptional regulator